MQVKRVSEQELGEKARIEGPFSPAARLLIDLSLKRARDRQVHVWELGAYRFIGPAPDAATEALLLRLVCAPCRSE